MPLNDAQLPLFIELRTPTNTFLIQDCTSLIPREGNRHGGNFLNYGIINISNYRRLLCRS